MADSIKDKKANYIRVKDILSSKYEEVDGYEFYKYIIKPFITLFYFYLNIFRKVFL